MATEIQLTDLFASYPAQDTPGIQTIVSAKQEFRELASSVTEPIPQRGKYYKHQRLVERLMKVMPVMLLMHETGTGKTCTFVAFAEWCRKMREQGHNIKRVYVLVKGPSLKNEFRNQLVCKCTSGEYETDLVKNATNAATRKGNLTREIKKWYSIKTYTKFANQIHSRGTDRRPEHRMTDEEIIEKYSDCAFFIDEIQNLRSEEAVNAFGQGGQGGDQGGTDDDETMRIWRTLWRVFHLAQRTRIVEASATPMVNSVNELPFMMNLILPENQQMPMDGSIDYNNATLEQMEPYLRGRVSYVRKLDTGAVAQYEGERIESEYQIDGRTVQSQLVVYASQMSDQVQEIGYMNATQQPGAFREAERQAANFVFPDGSYGGTAPRMARQRRREGAAETVTEAQRRTAEWGFGKWVVSEAPDQYRPTDELLPWLQNMQYMRMLSAKYSETVRLCSSEPGNCFCYSEFVTGSGAVMLGLCFEAQGYERFNETTSVFLGTGGAGGLAPYCAPPDRAAANRRIRIDKRPRYALLTSETILSEPKLNAILELMNSWENRHGEYLKVLIGSPIAREGLSINNCVQIHIPPTWNEASAYQALSRGLRVTSHDDLIQEERQRLIALGQDPANARVVVKIYRHAAVTNQGTSVDLEMYQLSEFKNRQIARMMRIMKQCAIDCQIHYQRNVRETDVDYSAACDFDVCAYRCVNPNPEELDTSTYDLYYAGEVVELAIEDIKEVFQDRFSFTLEELYQHLPEYRSKFLLMALERIMTEKMVLYDRFGYQSYLRIDPDGDTVFLTRDFPLRQLTGRGGETLEAITQDYPLAYYTQNLIANLPASLTAHVSRVQSDEQLDVIQQLGQLDPQDPQFDRLLDELNIDNRVALLENAVFQYAVQGVTTPSIAGIINKYRSVLYSLREPITEITRSAQALANRGKGRGRKPNPNTKLKLKKYNPATNPTQDVEPVVETDTEQVYIHTAYNQVYDRVAYAVTSRFNKAEGRIRLLKPSENIGWRDANPYELPVYNAIIQREIARRSQEFEQYGIYGTVLYDNMFRIVDKATEKRDLTATDARMFNRGKKCTTWLKSQLVDLMWRLQLRSPDYDTGNPFNAATSENENQIRQEVIQYLVGQRIELPLEQLQQQPNDWLRFYFTWYRSGMTRDDICDYIKQYLEQNGRLMVV